MASSDVARAVLNGEADDDLMAVYRAFKARSATLRSLERAQVLATVKVGDRVRLKGLRPAYLNGLVGTVAAVGGKVRVTLDDPRLAGKFKAAATYGPLGVPATSLDVLPADYPKQQATEGRNGALILDVPFDDDAEARAERAWEAKHS